MVKSERLYSPQEYLDAVLGECYLFDSYADDDIKEIEEILKKEDKALWNYPLTEIDHIVENGIDVVLVDCMVWSTTECGFNHTLRWFEVPSDFIEEEDV